MSTSQAHWTDLNQQYLVSALAAVRAALERHAGGAESAVPAGHTMPMAESSEHEGAGLPAPPALETLAQTFGLSPFERAILLLCAGIELDASFARLCTEGHGDPGRPYPTFSLALA